MPSMGSLQLAFKWLKLSLLLSLSILLLFLFYSSILPKETDPYSVPIDNKPLHTHTHTSLLTIPSGNRVLLVVQKYNGIIAKFLQHLRIEFDVCYLQQKCILPGYYLPATYHYSLIVFSDSAYSNIPARLSNSISK